MRPSRTPLLAVLVVAVLAAACGGSSRAASDPSPAETSGVLTALTGGDPLPEATLTVLGGDEIRDTVQWRGTPTVINFWATWCAFCVEEMPDLEATHQTFGDQVRFIGIDREDRIADALAFAAEVGVTYEQVEDPDGAYFRAVQGRGMPTTVFVDGDGIIQYRHAGPLTADRLAELIAEHLGVTA